MRRLREGVLMLGLPLLLAAAAPEAQGPDLRLTPSADVSMPLHLPSPPVTPPPGPSVSYGPQRIDFPGGVIANLDVTYANLRGYRPLTLDLYQPPASSTALPLLVFVHGGGWNGGDARHASSFADFPRQLAALAAQGYVVASVNYRLSGEARFPAAVQDVKAAIRWLRGQARTFNIDVSRAAVWGDGAGGQLAALTGVTCGVAPFEPQTSGKADEVPSDCVQAVIDWGGASDLETLAADALPESDAAGGFKPAPPGFEPPPASDEGSFLGCEPARCPPMLARLASPMAFLSDNSPAFLIQQGAADASVPAKQSRKLYDALHKAGVPVELIVYPDVGQNFTRGDAPDLATLQAAANKVGSFLAATFPPAPIAPKLAQPRGSLY